MCDAFLTSGGNGVDDCGYTNAMNWETHITVASIVYQGDCFLMVRERASGRVVLNQPAGHVEAGESLLAAVVRETLEETGWHFSPEALVGVYQYQLAHKRRTYLRFAFCGSVTRHEADRPLDEGILEAPWMSLEQLRQQSDQLRSPMVLRAIKDYQSGRRYSLDLLTHLDLSSGPALLLAGNS